MWRARAGNVCISGGNVTQTTAASVIRVLVGRARPQTRKGKGAFVRGVYEKSGRVDKTSGGSKVCDELELGVAGGTGAGGGGRGVWAFVATRSYRQSVVVAWSAST